MNHLEMRLLGGFEVRLDGELVTAFESQKARALLAYLALHPGERLPRERIASLLWSERPDESARRNLRQALYSLRTLFTERTAGDQLFSGGQRTIGFAPDFDLWVDVSAFRLAIRRGSTDHGDDPRHLAAAVRLYRGDLLAGFFVRDCPAYEEWLLAEQEALREEAVDALRTLVSAYLSRGEARFGIQYAKRLLAIDPLSEEAHRQLMRLYLVAGRRNSALAHYEHLRNLLNEELGVEPLEETADLYRSILLEAHATEVQRRPQPVGPLIPLVARSEIFDSLAESWSKVLEGHGRLTLVCGERGVGKTRVARSFVDVATSRRDTVVLRGRCFADAPLISYGFFAELLASAYTDVLSDEDVTRSRLPPATLEHLVAMAPDSAPVLHETLGLEIDAQPTDAETSLEAWTGLLDALAGPPSGEARPVVLLIDDLQWADPPALDLLAALVEAIARRPVWILATLGDGGVHPLLDAEPPAAITEGVDRLVLAPLTTADLDELAGDLVDHNEAGKFSAFLWNRSGGSPQRLAEVVNYLWDTSGLVATAPGHWELTADPETLVENGITSGELVRQRFDRLPASTRRLLALAAVSGHQFDVEILRLAGDEHPTVVETCVELALERWLIRQHPRRWSQAGMTQDLVLWARGARRGFFEFAHGGVRDAIRDAINPLRRRIMHRDVARALLARYPEDPSPMTESLADHHLAAGELEAALPWLERAIERAERTGGQAVAETHRQRARKVITRLLDSDPDADTRMELERRASALGD